MSEITNCTKCGAPIDEGNNAEFCKFCGVKLPKPEPQEITNNVTNVTKNVTNNYYTVAKEPRPKETVKIVEVSKKEPVIKVPLLQRIIKVGLPLIGLVLMIIGFNTEFKKGGSGLIVGGLIFWLMAVVQPTSKCSFCKNIIGTTARKCPHCGSRHSLPFRNKLAAIFIIAIGLFVFVAGKA